MSPRYSITVDRFIRARDSWQDFFQATTTLPARALRGTPDKGSVFERLTQLYLQTHPGYQTKLRDVWCVDGDLPRHVRERTGLPDRDEGIDLIAETYDGQLWAIQCKFRENTHKPLTVRDLSTFANLTHNVCRDVSLAVVAHTCSKPVRKKGLLGHTTEIGLDRWLALDTEDWQRIQAASSKPPPPPTARDPRPHQRRAIEDARSHFLDGGARRGRLIMPCGTGKSLTAFWIAQVLDPESVLVAVPSLSLIKQSITDWTREFLAYGEMPDWLCVCSDESTGRLDQDEFVGGVYELGVDATTDIDAIRSFLDSDSGKRKIVFTTYQSGRAVAEAARLAGFTFSLGIMDEAHRTVGSPDKSFSHLLLDENIPVTRRVFMTATERVVRGADRDVLSMDDPDMYGKCFHQLTFKEGIEAEPPIISDYKILTITVTDEHIRQLIEENRYLTADDDLGEREAQALAAGIALHRAFQEEGVRHAISFHRSIRGAKEFMAQHKHLVANNDESERPTCFHISSKKTTGERADLIREFRDSPVSLITNARCLQEGVDIPAVDCVLFADPKQSVVDIVQAAGRAMRPHQGKRFGYVVIPIVVPSDMDFLEFAETTTFKQVARVITALSTQDDRIAEEFRAVTTKPRQGGRILEIRGDVPVGYRIGLEEFRKQLELRLWERLGRANWRPFDEAREFARSLGLKSSAEWFRLAKGRMEGMPTGLPADIPKAPHQVYENAGWISFGDWLGTGAVAPGLREFRAFENARRFARDLGLKRQKDWHAYCAGDFDDLPPLPADIPTNPQISYSNKTWTDWGDWLGTGNVATSKRDYLSFEQARRFARGLGLSGETEWRKFKSGEMPEKGSLHDGIPANPNTVYRDEGWCGWGDWLGTGASATRDRNYRAFEDARTFVRSLGLSGKAEWSKYCKGGMPDKKKLPPDIPAGPSRVYASDGWNGWGDWLGTGSVRPGRQKWREFGEARDFARGLKLGSIGQWKKYCKGVLPGKDCRPGDIPSNPNTVYADRGWSNWADWLGTRTVPTYERVYWPFEKARAYVHSLELKSSTEWKRLCSGSLPRKHLPDDIPKSPRHVYRNNGWNGFGDWLGTGTARTQDRKYRDFGEARDFVRSLGLRNQNDWKTYAKQGLESVGKKPDDIPAAPWLVYNGKGWENLSDWLGTSTVATQLRAYRPFEEARAFARGLRLRSVEEWRMFCKGMVEDSGGLPEDIPANPHNTYKAKWQGYRDWLGTDRKRS